MANLQLVSDNPFPRVRPGERSGFWYFRRAVFWMTLLVLVFLVAVVTIKHGNH